MISVTVTSHFVVNKVTHYIVNCYEEERRTAMFALVYENKNKIDLDQSEGSFSTKTKNY